MRRYDHQLVRESNAQPDDAPPAVPTLTYEAPKSPDAYVEATATGAVLVLPEPPARHAYINLVLFAGMAAILFAFLLHAAWEWRVRKTDFWKLLSDLVYLPVILCFVVMRALAAWYEVRVHREGRRPLRQRLEFAFDVEPKTQAWPIPTRITFKRKPFSWFAPKWQIVLDYRKSFWSWVATVDKYDIADSEFAARRVARDLRELLKIPHPPGET